MAAEAETRCRAGRHGRGARSGDAGARGVGRGGVHGEVRRFPPLSRVARRWPDAENGRLVGTGMLTRDCTLPCTFTADLSRCVFVGTGTSGPMAARLALLRAQRQLYQDAGVHIHVRNFSVRANLECHFLVHSIPFFLCGVFFVNDNGKCTAMVFFPIRPVRSHGPVLIHER